MIKLKIKRVDRHTELEVKTIRSQPCFKSNNHLLLLILMHLKLNEEMKIERQLLVFL